MSVFDALGALLTHLADFLSPLFGGSATAAAVVALTMLVRLALHPLARSAARGEEARRELAPHYAELKRKHGDNPERMQRAVRELHAEKGVPLTAGCAPMLLQLPVFFVLYRLFRGHDAELLHHSLLGAPLTGHWTDALRAGGVLGPHGLVYLGLFAVLAAVATWNVVRSRRLMAAHEDAPAGGGLTAWLPLLSFGTLVTAAVLPLAVGLYLATSTTWTAAERALLHARRGRSTP